jgi:hypothetical protein
MGFWNGTQWDVPAQPSHIAERRNVRSAFTSASLITILILGLTAGSVFAAKPAGGGKGGGGTSTSSTLALTVMDDATEARHGGRVTFDVSTTATDRPFVGLRCWQGANWVYDGYVGYFPTAMFDEWFVLGSPYWTAGADASCTARLFHYDKRGSQKVLTTLSFPVLP